MSVDPSLSQEMVGTFLSGYADMWGARAQLFGRNGKYISALEMVCIVLAFMRTEKRC